MNDFFEIEEVPENWSVKEYKDADWAMQMIALATRRIEQREEQAKRLKEQIDRRLEEITRTDKASIEFFKSELEPWVHAEIADQKAKSTKMTFGTAGYRKGGGGLVVDDEEAAIKWCEENAPECLKKTLLKSEAKKHNVPGTSIEPPVENFYVKPDLSLFIEENDD